jgi:hypothetical protein
VLPGGIEKFAIIFKQNGQIELPDNCNFHYGSYRILDNDSLLLTDIGPGTKIYYLPDLLMDWEILFIHSLIVAKTYSINSNQLTIYCDSDYDLVFDFVDDYNKGKLLVFTNSNLLNCVFEIEFSINNVSYSLTAGLTYLEYECQCEDSLNIGVLLDLNEGTYAYIANELNCVGNNKINSWSGEIHVSSDSYTNIF